MYICIIFIGPIVPVNYGPGKRYLFFYFNEPKSQVKMAIFLPQIDNFDKVFQ